METVYTIKFKYFVYSVFYRYVSSYMRSVVDGTRLGTPATGALI